MAKYDVTYSCGHTGVVELFGPDKNRQYRLERLADEICPDCARAAKAAYAEKLGLTPLTGSEKQISWARDIQLKKLRELDDFEAELKAAPGADGPSAKIVFAALESVRASMKSETEAAKIIDRRDATVRQMVRDAVKKFN